MGIGTIQKGAVPVRQELFILSEKLCQYRSVTWKSSPALHAFHVQHIFAVIGGNVFVKRFLCPAFCISPDLFFYL
jgi:hypothetical protein